MKYTFSKIVFMSLVLISTSINASPEEDRELFHDHFKKLYLFSNSMTVFFKSSYSESETIGLSFLKYASLYFFNLLFFSTYSFCTCFLFINFIQINLLLFFLQDLIFFLFSFPLTYISY